ncbi:4414_t:CDS:2 [Acaulospora colombiana]|uniref:4414_t:CDS:1 n=1 Tax=Acaulospora colombiana TaxID=27376 RepID=A0ACA9K4K0_9GLOM|nr:4414_t:CDS:2 [Acaulospora colombiana]
MRRAEHHSRPHYNNYPAQQQYYAQQQYQNQDSSSVILVTAGYDHTIRFWEALSGICSRTIQHPDSITSFDGHTGNVTAVGFHCEGKWMVTSSEDGTLKIWDTRHVILKKMAPSIQRNYDHKAPVNDVAIHPNQGELISCDQKGSIKIWDLSENSCTHELVPEEDVPLRSVTIAADGSMFVAANNKKLIVKTYDLFDAPLASSDHSARLWDLQQGETIRQYNGHHKAAVCVALNDLSIGN